MRVTEAPPGDDSAELEEFGYEQELEAEARRLPDVRDLVRVHLRRGGHLRDLRRRSCRSGGPFGIWVWIIAADRADAGGAGHGAVRGPHPAQRILVPMGVAAGQPEDRLGVRLAELLLPGRSGWWRSTTRWPARRSCRCSSIAPDEGTARLITLGDPARPGGARDRLDAHRRPAQLERGGPRADDRRGAGDRAVHRRRRHRRRLGRTTSPRAASPRATPTTSRSAAA